MSALEGSLAVGDIVTATIGPVAHGGHFVARVPAGERDRVVFVRHALPGEVVDLKITEDSGSFLRGEAVTIHQASPDRVEAPCVLAFPGGCGGCDFQHVELAAQRGLKAAVVQEQLQRLAGISRDVVVEAVPDPQRPGIDDGLRWRTRMQYVDLPGRRRGLRRYRSHDVIEVQDCLIDAGVHRPAVATETVRGREFTVDGDGFWQVHPGAAEALVDAVMAMGQPKPGEKALDLYAGVGLFTAFLAEAVGNTGEVVAVESDRRATEHAVHNLEDLGWASVVFGRVDKVLAHSANLEADVVVLDPPRAGAKRQVVEAIAALQPRAVVYVACDPAALARDVKYFADQGYDLAELRAFDVFPMTHHVECVALLTKTGSDLH